MKKPVWGKVAAAHIEQLELIIESFESLLSSIQKAIFSVKALWFTAGGFSVYTFFAEKFDWQVLSQVIN